MLIWLVYALVTLAVAFPHFPRQSDQEDNSSFPVVNLGPSGSYMGILQNNGTVQSWKGIPYAQPPVGELRFMPPRPLPPQPSKIVNMTAKVNRCVQFTLAPYGVHNAYLGPGTPGQEDCLKLFIRKPAQAKAGNKLPVLVFIHAYLSTNLFVTLSIM